MNIRHLASRILPPIIYDAARRRRNISPSFASYEEAAASCSGYDDPDIAKAIAHHTKLLYARLISPAPTFTAGEIKTVWAATQAVRGGVLDVIDFGGACGCHYFAVRAGLPSSVMIRWHVIETAAMARAGRELVGGLGTRTRDELRFHMSWESARNACAGPDLLYSSSAIICMPQPLDCLQEHIACGARFMLFTRIGLTDGAPLYSVQARLLSKGVSELAPGITDHMVSYPLTWPPRKFFERTLQQEYDIVARLEEENPIFVVGDVPVTGYGCLARRKR